MHFTSEHLRETLWVVFGATGVIIFQSRFYVQWIVSELKRRSVVPVVFWYLSIVGALMLLVYANYDRDPIAALSYGLNVVIYSRNLIHIWREQGRLTRGLHAAANGFALVTTIAALLVIGRVWLYEYQLNQQMTSSQAAKEWLWVGVGLGGNMLFAGRFLIQWIATELRRKSVFPTVFWHLSLAASALQLVYFVREGLRGKGEFAGARKWIYAAGIVAGMVIYARNLWLIYRHQAEDEREIVAK